MIEIFLAIDAGIMAHFEDVNCEGRARKKANDAQDESDSMEVVNGRKNQLTQADHCGHNCEHPVWYATTIAHILSRL